MTHGASFSTHDEPVWRDAANFVINAVIETDDDSLRFEQLWARQRSESQFEICCIPFFIYDLALGDVVETASTHGMKYVLDRVRLESGHTTFRVFFQDGLLDPNFIEDLTGPGVLMEWSSQRLLAVDAEDSPTAKRIADALWRREQGGELEYETGRTAPR